MNNQIVITLKKRIEEISAYGRAGVEAQRNALKEELQFYVLNFIYHHPDYDNWIMYGGSALRICHGLDRMSVDLDFEIDNEITNNFLDNLKEEIITHFENSYGVNSDFLTIGITNNRGLILKFNIAKELGLAIHSNQVRVKIDLNRFVATKTITERIPINRNQLAFAIKTYNMSALMASKIAAIFLRGQRGVGEAMYEEKGRDIYDLLWYMGKKIIPDLDYLKEKDLSFADPKELFNKITIKILNNEKTDANLKGDLTPLFLDQAYIENWLKNWRDSYLRMLEEYKINTITDLRSISIQQDFHTDVFSFFYHYNTKGGNSVRIIYKISDYWIGFGEGNLSINVDEKIKSLVEFNGVAGSGKSPSRDKLMQYAELFYNKTENYFRKTNRVMFGDTIATKVIRMTADNLNQKEQILLNKSALENAELDDLLK